jgi:mevalonate kinase
MHRNKKVQFDQTGAPSMTQDTVFKVSDDSLQTRRAATERNRADPENPDFSAWFGTDLTHDDVMAIEREARELRSRVFALMIRRMGRSIERAFWRLRQRDIERYLAKSSDLSDLERRIRDLERGRGPGLGGLSY